MSRRKGKGVDEGAVRNKREGGDEEGSENSGVW